VAIDHGRLVQGLENALGDQRSFFATGDPIGQDQKFIPTQARDRVRLARRSDQASGEATPLLETFCFPSAKYRFRKWAEHG